MFKHKNKMLIICIFLDILALFYIELAVGIFGTSFAGS